eukprot:7187422-Prymnesium_polylepis.2
MLDTATVLTHAPASLDASSGAVSALSPWSIAPTACKGSEHAAEPVAGGSRPSTRFWAEENGLPPFSWGGGESRTHLRGGMDAFFCAARRLARFA